MLKALLTSQCSGWVDYFNEHEFHGNMPSDKLGYQKRSMFSLQREYRVKIDLFAPLGSNVSLLLRDA